MRKAFAIVFLCLPLLVQGQDFRVPEYVGTPTDGQCIVYDDATDDRWEPADCVTGSTTYADSDSWTTNLAFVTSGTAPTTLTVVDQQSTKLGEWVFGHLSFSANFGASASLQDYDYFTFTLPYTAVTNASAFIIGNGQHVYSSNTWRSVTVAHAGAASTARITLDTSADSWAWDTSGTGWVRVNFTYRTSE